MNRCRTSRRFFGSATLFAILVTLAALTIGVSVGRAAVTCPRGEVLVPFASTWAGPEARGDCIPVRTGAAGATRVDPRYGYVATELLSRFAALRGAAARNAIVVCWSVRDWRALDRRQRQQEGDGLGNVAGFVYIPWNVINLSPATCRGLDRVVQSGRGARELAFHVTTLAHEALHVAGIVNEARTECFAIQLTADTARLLGLGDRDAREAARSSLADYARYGQENPTYWTPNCHNDTALDLRPGVLSFP